MAKSPSEQFREIAEAITKLDERTDSLRRDLVRTEADAEKARDHHSESRTKVEEEFRRTREEVARMREDMVRVQKDTEQLRKEWDEWDRKRWLLVGLFVGAALTLLSNLTLLLFKR